MDKKNLYMFSIELKKLLEKHNTEEVVNRINQKNLSKAELDFLFMCLHSEGYDPKTDSFIICDSDNSAFLALVDLVQSKLSAKE